MQEEEALQLVDSMLEHDALSQLVYRLRQFNEAVPEEAEAVQKLLSVFENMIEVKPAVAEQLVQLGDNKTGFLRYVIHPNLPTPHHLRAHACMLSTITKPYVEISCDLVDNPGCW